jgi:hypothetical protein
LTGGGLGISFVADRGDSKWSLTMQRSTFSKPSKGRIGRDLALAVALAALSAGPSLAGPHGGGGGMGPSGRGGGGMGGFGGASASHISARGMAHTNGPNAADRDFGAKRAADVGGRGHASNHARRHGSRGGAGGQSASHMSAQGLANTNGPNAADRDFGAKRAADRANPNGGR